MVQKLPSRGVGSCPPIFHCRAVLGRLSHKMLNFLRFALKIFGLGGKKHPFCLPSAPALPSFGKAVPGSSRDFGSSRYLGVGEEWWLSWWSCRKGREGKLKHQCWWGWKEKCPRDSMGPSTRSWSEKFPMRTQLGGQLLLMTFFISLLVCVLVFWYRSVISPVCILKINNLWFSNKEKVSMDLPQSPGWLREAAVSGLLWEV